MDSYGFFSCLACFAHVHHLSGCSLNGKWRHAEMEENGVSDLLPSAEDTIQTKARKWESSRPTQGGAHQGASQPSGVQKGGDGFSLKG